MHVWLGLAEDVEEEVPSLDTHACLPLLLLFRLEIARHQLELYQFLLDTLKVLGVAVLEPLLRDRPALYVHLVQLFVSFSRFILFQNLLASFFHRAFSLPIYLILSTRNHVSISSFLGNLFYLVILATLMAAIYFLDCLLLGC